MSFHHITHPHPFRPAADMSRFFVITPITNPVRFSRRYELYWRFREMCEAAEVQLITVELQLGLRPFMVTEPGNPFHVQMRTVEELWHKENQINVGMARAMQMGAREIAWVDADCRPAATPRHWFEETWHALQHYEFVQMWETLIDLDLNHNAITAPQPSFMANYLRYGTPNPADMTAIQKRDGYPYGANIFGRPGLAWAANVDALNKVGRLVDYCILGAGDWYMAHALIGSLSHAIGGEAQSSWQYVRQLYHWQDLCERWIKRDVGFVPGLVFHDWHGTKLKRGYGTRGVILKNNHYNPLTDIKPDANGVIQLETWEPRQIKLRDEIRAYLRSRDEDATH